MGYATCFDIHRHDAIDCAPTAVRDSGIVRSSQTKIRLLGDFRAIGVTDYVSAPDTEIPQDLDVFPATAALYQSRFPNLPLGAFSVVYAHAYKNVPLCRDQREFVTIALTPPAGSPKAARLRAHSFVSARAPANWVRVTRFVQWALGLLFGVDLKLYVGDCYGIEPIATRSSAFYATKGCNALLGLGLAGGKESPPSEHIDLLGAYIVLTPGSIEESLPDHRKEQLSAGLKQLISPNVLTPADAPSGAADGDSPKV